MTSDAVENSMRQVELKNLLKCIAIYSRRPNKDFRECKQSEAST